MFKLTLKILRGAKVAIMERGMDMATINVVGKCWRNR
jgi:hypothetical protein